MSILHDRTKSTHKNTFNKINFPKIDYVIVNLYPFSKFIKQNNKDIIEMIDIGGPTLLRAGAKNFESVTTICSVSDYVSLKKNIEKNVAGTDLSFRKKWHKRYLS